MESFKRVYNQMADDYESLLNSGNLSDVVLVVGGNDLRVHKLVLSARSPVFAAMFAHDTKEAQENRVQIVDVDVEVVELMVRYIYTGKVDTLGLQAADLFVAADKYQLDCLKAICMQQILSQISPESVCDILIFADKYQFTELNTQDLALKCLDYITGNGIRVIVSEGWKKIVAQTDLLANLFENMSLKYSKLIYYARSEFNFEDLRLLNLSDEMKVEWKLDDGQIDWGLSPDLDFQNYLIRNSNAIAYKDVMTDVILVAGTKELRVHKKMLSARSPVFAAMFSHEIAQKNCGVIAHIDVEILKLLIKYIYTGKVEELDQNAAKLWVVSDKFQLTCLKSICKDHLLSEAITIESVSDHLIIADMYENTKLYIKCLEYIANNVTQVIASEGWKRIVTLKPDLLAKICESLNLSFSEQLLLSPITLESVLNLLILSDMHQATELITKCVDYITDNVTEVMQQEDWKNIVLRGDLVAKLFAHMSLKYTRFNWRNAVRS